MHHRLRVVLGLPTSLPRLEARAVAVDQNLGGSQLPTRRVGERPLLARLYILHDAVRPDRAKASKDQAQLAWFGRPLHDHIVSADHESIPVGPCETCRW